MASGTTRRRTDAPCGGIDVRIAPELLRTFECALERNSQENAVLWELLDSLRGSGLPAPKALAAISSSAHDERTLQRLAALSSPEAGRSAEAAARLSAMR